MFAGRLGCGLLLVVAVSACSGGGASGATGTGRPSTGPPGSASSLPGSSPTTPRTSPAANHGSRASPVGATKTAWTVYHRYASGSGAGPAKLALSALKAAWTSRSLDGTLYGEPLVWHGRVFVATENDTVYALSVSSGAILWRHHLATAVPSGALPCGNISPRVGITSTPVLDAARRELFVVADEMVGGRPRHELFGLEVARGAVVLRQRVDPPGSDPAALLQRASLTLDRGHVIFGFGGNYGDCSRYHGYLESVPVAGGHPRYFEVDRAPGDSQGAIWMGGAAPIVTASGELFAAAGNGSVTSPSGRYDHSDSVLALSPSLRLVSYFAPADWYADNAGDRDLGSAVPAVLGNGLVLQAGKSDTLYLLRAAHLGGVGGEVAERTGFCGANVDGGVAFAGHTAYLPCQNGVTAVATDAAHLRVKILWRTPTGAGGPPILAGGRVWTISGGSLYGLSPRTGAALERATLGPSATSFPTPSVGDGHLFATSATEVHAFVGR